MKRLYAIEPVPAPRMTRSDRWKKRPCVLKYRAFRDHVRALGLTITEADHVTFVLPMPPSWSKAKRAQMDGQPHRQKPDIDNLWKAITDALHADDSHLATMSASKVWGTSGKIIVEEMAL